MLTEEYPMVDTKTVLHNLGEEKIIISTECTVYIAYAFMSLLTCLNGNFNMAALSPLICMLSRRMGSDANTASIMYTNYSE
jgi:hypothetical protein